MIRLSTSVITSAGDLVLIPSMPKSPLAPTKDDVIDVGDIMLDDQIDVKGLFTDPTDGSGTSGEAKSDPPPASSLPVDSVNSTKTYTFLSAYLLRYAFRLPGENWDMKIADFKSKFADMVGFEFSDNTPSQAWANSFNLISKDLKHKFRIVIHMIITTHGYVRSGCKDLALAQKMYRYLFATPFSYYGLAAIIQLKKCADSLDVQIENFMSALTVTELQTGMHLINQILTSAITLSWWPYARAFDDSFFTEMSSLSIKKVHYVCLVILNMKGGQARPIVMEKVKSIASVRDRDTLTNVAAKIVAAIDLSRPATTTSTALKQMEKDAEFQSRTQSYVKAASEHRTSVINQPVIDISSLMT
nr:MAG: putative nucleocapsid protein [Picris cytorhabdovirus 1]